MTLNEWADLDEDVAGELVDGVLEDEKIPSFLHEIIVSFPQRAAATMGAPPGWARGQFGRG